jgi:Abnormal spindle-like microcephaly-assoc'd, ASPM-SPD-2-Hydin
MNKTVLVCLSVVFFGFLSILFAAPAQASVELNPTSLSFGSVAVNTASPSASIVVTNNGKQTISIEEITSSLPEFVVSGISLPLSLGPQSTTSFSVVFQPAAAATYSGKIRITLSGRDRSAGTVSVTGTGIAAATPATYLLSASASSLAFGSTLVGSSASQSISLANTGTGSVTISQVTVSSAAFGVSGFSGAVTLAAGQSLALAVTFTPSATGSATGSLTVTSNASNSPVTISLSGTGIQPQISVTPASASFGNVTTGVTNTQTITISNPGTANLTVSQASMSGSGFAYSGLTTPLTVAPGGSSPFTVSFDPTTAGSFTGTLTLVNSATPSAAVSLSGTGVAQTLQVSASPTSVSFGSVTTGTSATQTVTLTNTGNANVSLSNDSVTGTGFSVTGLTLPLTLNAGQSTSFSVVFDPSSAGSASGSLSVTSNATNSPTTIALSGTGTSPATYTVTLSWTPSSSSYSGFNAYRSTVSGGPYTKLDSSIIASPTYSDSTVTSGQTYYYVVTEVSTSGVESSYSSQTSVTIP